MKPIITRSIIEHHQAHCWMGQMMIAMMMRRHMMRCGGIGRMRD